MSYFDGLEFFIVLVPLLGITVLLKLWGLQGKGWITGLSLGFAIWIYRSSPGELAALAVYIASIWVILNWFLQKRGVHKRKGPYYKIALGLTLAPLVLNKLFPVLNLSPLGFLGLSYISFKSLQMVIEIQDGLIKDLSLSDYLPFMTFFPTMSSGPIDRSRRFSEDLNGKKSREEYLELLGSGLFTLILGLVYKFVLADYLYGHLQRLTLDFHPMRNLAYMYVYGFYLFFDFAGYSNLAVGTANILGINTPINFDKPFLSVDIKDFWNRWHMSLSFWFRDFLFSRIVKGFIKKKRFSTMQQTAAISYMINMGMMGAWHGLSSSYLLYGLYHGVLLALTDLYQQRSEFYKTHRNQLSYRAFSTIVTFHLAMIGFFIFSGRFAAWMKYLFF